MNKLITNLFKFMIQGSHQFILNFNLTNIYAIVKLPYSQIQKSKCIFKFRRMIYFSINHSTKNGMYSSNETIDIIS